MRQIKLWRFEDKEDLYYVQFKISVGSNNSVISTEIKKEIFGEINALTGEEITFGMNISLEEIIRYALDKLEDEINSEFAFLESMIGIKSDKYGLSFEHAGKTYTFPYSEWINLSEECGIDKRFLSLIKEFIFALQEKMIPNPKGYRELGFDENGDIKITEFKSADEYKKLKEEEYIRQQEEEKLKKEAEEYYSKVINEITGREAEECYSKVMDELQEGEADDIRLATELSAGNG